MRDEGRRPNARTSSRSGHEGGKMGMSSEMQRGNEWRNVLLCHDSLETSAAVVRTFSFFPQKH